MSNRNKVKAHGSDDEEDFENENRETIMSRETLGMRDSLGSTNTT